MKCSLALILVRPFFRLTCYETLLFASMCKSRGKLSLDYHLLDDDERKIIEKMDKDVVAPNIVLAGLGLSEVKDTFVGSTTVRGVSGGQRRRVTVGEMLISRAPVLCGDEISTGLDAASTYDMIQLLVLIGRTRAFTRVISLLQPSPETVSLFDEIILLSEGRIIYAGPVAEVENYFADIGFMCPPFMDVADFLQMVSTEDGAALYKPTPEMKQKCPKAPLSEELSEMFNQSTQGRRIKALLDSPLEYVWNLSDRGSVHGSSKLSTLAMSKSVKRKYANNFFRSTQLILWRFLKLWVRDRRILIAGAIKNIIMGVSVGGIYFSTTDVISIQGALFQGILFIMLGMSVKQSMKRKTWLKLTCHLCRRKQVPCRIRLPCWKIVLFFTSKQVSMQKRLGLPLKAPVLDACLCITRFCSTDANFYSAWPFVFGRAISQLPQVRAFAYHFCSFFVLTRQLTF